MSNIICLLGIIHVLGDFYFKSEKEEKIKYQFINLLILLMLSTVFLTVFGFEINLLIVLVINLLVHNFINIIKYGFKKKLDKSNQHEKLAYCLDQLLHIVTIFILAAIFKDKISFSSNWATHTAKIQKFFPLMLAVLLNGKPANKTFKILFSNFKPKDENDNIDEQSVGRWIGTLERLIIMLLFIMGEIGSVALIIAAKTLTRYKKITDDVEFAEYYLLGTLYSLGYSFIVALLLLRGVQI
ncbi:DUF3307 domain-containing protein [Haploplasma axanthum]|nr:DUF3307 domain-containing protein [Haploplasma axanthum]